MKKIILNRKYILSVFSLTLGYSALKEEDITKTEFLDKYSGEIKILTVGFGLKHLRKWLWQSKNFKATAEQVLIDTYFNELHQLKKEGIILAEWVASTAKVPSLAHMANYDKIFNLKKGIKGQVPSERYGCQCSSRILKGNEVIKQLNKNIRTKLKKFD